MKNPAHDIMWTEAHRPTSLDEVALDPENKKLFQEYLEQGEFPHLLLSGPAGCGKTTVAQILIEGIGASSIELNASDERGIDTIREKVKTFAQGLMGSDLNVVFLDESDQLTGEAMSALRRVMEKYSGKTRLILTCNYPNRIIEPVRSRCTQVEMSEIPPKERAKVLKRVLDAEDAQYDTETVVTYARAFSDLRKMLSEAQRSVITNNGVLQAADHVSVSGEEILKACLNKNWNRILEISQSRNFDHSAALEDLFWAITELEGFSKKASWLVEVHKAVNGWKADEVVNFVGTCAALIKSLE